MLYNPPLPTGTVGGGTPIPYTGSTATITAQFFEMDYGSSITPILTPGPIMRVARVGQLAVANLGGAGGTYLTNEASAAGVFLNTESGPGVAGTYMQANAIFAYAQSIGTGNWDAVGAQLVGRVSGSASARGTGAYIEGRKDVTGSKIGSCEIRGSNYNTQNDATDFTYNTSGACNTFGLWVSANCAGTANPTMGAAIQVGSASGTGNWGVGIGFVSGGTVTADIRSDSSATTSILMNGTHSYGIDMRGSTITTLAMALPNATKIGWENFAGTGTINCLYLDTSNRLNIDNSVANPGVLISSGTNIQLSTGTGTQLGTAAAQKLGFWGATPVIQPGGWGSIWTGTLLRGTQNTGTATLATVAEALGALINDLFTAGLIGA